MSIRSIEFTELDREISKAGKSHLDLLAPEAGRVYVVAISRDKCPACERQKPRMDELFYPTNLILVRTKYRGVIELYGNVSPRMSELKRSIGTAVGIANMLENESSMRLF